MVLAVFPVHVLFQNLAILYQEAESISLPLEPGQDFDRLNK